jgi:hypothetical protein
VHRASADGDAPFNSGNFYDLLLKRRYTLTMFNLFH